MAGEILKQLYKRTKTGDMVSLDKIWPNSNHINVDSVSDTSDEGLTSLYGGYDLVVCANKTWYRQYAPGKWITGNGGDTPGPGPGPTPTTDTAYSGFVQDMSELEGIVTFPAGYTTNTISNNAFNTGAGEGPIVWFAIESTKTVVSAENNNFAGDFIQDSLEQGAQIAVEDKTYQIYIYNFGMTIDNTYHVIIS